MEVGCWGRTGMRHSPWVQNLRGAKTSVSKVIGEYCNSSKNQNEWKKSMRPNIKIYNSCRIWSFLWMPQPDSSHPNLALAVAQGCSHPGPRAQQLFEEWRSVVLTHFVDQFLLSHQHIPSRWRSKAKGAAESCSFAELSFLRRVTLYPWSPSLVQPQALE